MKKSTIPRPSNAVLRETMIREAAYYRAEQRAFAPGKELEDWIAAEQEIDALLIRDIGGSPARKSRANTAKNERRAS